MTQPSKPGSSRYEAHNAKMARVDEIYKKIHNEHGSQYSAEQKRSWAHLIEMGKHDSLYSASKKVIFPVLISRAITSKEYSHCISSRTM